MTKTAGMQAVGVVLLILLLLAVATLIPPPFQSMRAAPRALEFYESVTTGLPRNVHVYCRKNLEGTGSGRVPAIVTFETGGVAVADLCP